MQLAVTPYLYIPAAALRVREMIPPLGRAVVGLADARREGAGRDPDQSAGFLLAHDRRGGPKDGEGALQVGRDHRIPLLFAHVEEHPFAEDARHADDAVDLAKAIDRGLHDARAARHFGDAIGVGNGLAAEGFDLGDHGIGHLTGRLLSVHRDAVIVDHDLCALPGRVECDGASDAAARACDCDDLAVQISHISS